MPKFNKFKFQPLSRVVVVSAGLILVILASYLGYQARVFARKVSNLQQELAGTKEKLQSTNESYDALKNQDQVKINQELNDEIKNIHDTFGTTVESYEKLLDLKDSSGKTEALDELFSDALTFLSKQNYSSASETLSTLNNKIEEERAKTEAAFKIPENVPVQNAPPGSGYSRQQVQTDAGTFMISLVAADIGSTRVIVDTASDGTCTDNCPVLPLATYVSRNGAFAGVNGTYFCPAAYPSCAGKTNSFDLLAMNKNKTYFNSDNNVYSNNPGVIFGGGYIRFVSAVSQWGRDTGIDSMLSNYPLLVFNNGISFGGDDDPKKGSRGARSFVANKGNTIYIGVVHSATVAESARVMKSLGMENAMNLDDGGSTALWSGGYKVGPGRDLPNVILFVGK